MKRIPFTDYSTARLDLDDVWQIIQVLSDHFSNVEIILGDILIEQPHELTEAATELVHRNKKKHSYPCMIRGENEISDSNSKKTRWICIDIDWKHIRVSMSDLRDPALSDAQSEIETILKRRRLPKWPKQLSIAFLVVYGLFVSEFIKNTPLVKVFGPIMWVALAILAGLTYRDYSGGVDLRGLARKE